MKSRFDIARVRQAASQLIRPSAAAPEEIVGWLSAVQSQDFAGAAWGIAQRLARPSLAAVEAAYAEGRILRTHVLRPTWHFVLPEDLKWMMVLSAPRLKQVSGFYLRQQEIDEALIARANVIIRKAIERDGPRTRDELAEALGREAIAAKGIRLAYVLMAAEWSLVVCGGPRRGKQLTYGLVDDVTPRGRVWSREKAAGALAERYFRSHGPATLKDFAWWSGLTLTESRSGLEAVRASLRERVVEGVSYWEARGARGVRVPKGLVRLLPNYDELLVAHQDHALHFDSSLLGSRTAEDVFWSQHVVVVDGRIIGAWRPKLGAARATVSLDLLRTLSEAERAGVEREVARYGEALGLAAGCCLIKMLTPRAPLDS